MPKFSDIYDERYRGAYREHLCGYEIARWEALEHFIMRVLPISDARMVLDYGAGSGLHVGLWEKVFPESMLHFCDISPVAKEKFAAKFPQRADSYHLVRKNRTDFADKSFDVIASVEVMEHVEDLAAYVQDVHRLLEPGGWFLWTTPCGNRYSIEHIYSFLAMKIEATAEGYRRWQWEDPSHLRRLKSREIKAVLNDSGFDEVIFRFRSHVFSFTCTYCPFLSFACTHFPTRGIANYLRNKLLALDYDLFRRLPNGASMLGAARRVSA